MNEAVRLTLALTVVCTVASAVLAFADKQTRTARNEATLQSKLKALSQVAPSFDNRPLEDRYPVDEAAFATAEARFYRARRDGELVGIVGEGFTKSGFGGDLRVLVGITPGGEIGSVLVSAHKETPGLGTVATDRSERRTLAGLLRRTKRLVGSSALPPNTYLDQYTGRDIADRDALKVRQDGGAIDAVSGATVSSRAISDAVQKVSAAFAEHRADIVSGGRP